MFASLAPTEDNQDKVGDEEKATDEEMNEGRQKQETADSAHADRYTEDAQIHRAILQANRHVYVEAFFVLHSELLLAVNLEDLLCLTDPGTLSLKCEI